MQSDEEVKSKGDANSLDTSRSLTERMPFLYKTCACSVCHEALPYLLSESCQFISCMHG